jgi:nuclear pore complex protein Nup133
MFSPDSTLLSARGSQRNPRRRQRKDSDGLQQQPRRKRSKLGEDTFVSHSPKDGRVNGNGSVTMNGHVGHGDADSSLVLVDMPVREKKGSAKRALKDDTTHYLVSSFRPKHIGRC